ncbi:MAG: hypothetical protein HQL92_04935 [Magnetococcales bacterium]|nr:hypothetical protein [Magnetococcales bacterium]
MMVLMAGCAVFEGAMEETRVARRLVAGRDYRSLSECLFRHGVEEGRPLDLAVYGCVRRAELVEGAERVQIVAGDGGVVVEGSGAGLARLEGNLQRCAVRSP